MLVGNLLVSMKLVVVTTRPCKSCTDTTVRSVPILIISLIAVCRLIQLGWLNSEMVVLKLVMLLKGS